MDQRFLDFARQATADSTRVQPVFGSLAGSRLRAEASGATQAARTFSPRVRLQLIEAGEFLEWEEVTGVPLDLGRFRSGTAAAGESFEAIELEFDRLPPSQITQFLNRCDKRLTPARGLRRWDEQAQRLVPTALPSSGRALLLIHGTFSKSENLIAPLRHRDNEVGGEFFREALRSYEGQVFTFDHPTLAVGPILNAFDLQAALGDSGVELDIVAHSRGGLVARWWCETFDPQAERCRKVILVGSPLAGTGLAAPPNIRSTIDLLTYFARALRLGTGLVAAAVPVFAVVEALLRVVTSVTSLAARTPVVDAAMALVPGLFSMSRVGNNPELGRLLALPQPPSDRYFAVCSDFQPRDPAWKFWRRFRRERIADTLADPLFDDANDLVVDTGSMTTLSDQWAIAPHRQCDFGVSERVHHLNYFAQPRTAGFLGDVLL